MEGTARLRQQVAFVGRVHEHLRAEDAAILPRDFRDARAGLRHGLEALLQIHGRLRLSEQLEINFLRHARLEGPHRRVRPGQRARTRLTTALQQPGVANPGVLGGDVHEKWVGHVLADYARAGSKKVGVEFCGTSITSKAGKADSSAALLQENPHFVFANGQYRGYGLADFTPGQLNVRLRVLDDVLRQDSTVRTLAAFAVEAGRAEVLPL